MTIHLKVSKNRAQDTINRLKLENLIDHDYQVQRDDSFVYVPILKAGVMKIYADTETVDIPPVESKTRYRPRTAGGAFDLIGNIAITKIRNRERAEKLAEDLIASSPVVKTVFLDKGIIGDFRLRDLELLKGDNNFIAAYRENGLLFELDVSKVYFSPRLATERMFVSRDVKDGECVIDMFAGIGAFSLNIAKHHNVSITAIDSNPDAIRHMESCIALNSLKGDIKPVFGMAEDIVPGLPEADRIIMNLPHDSSRFLRLAAGKLKKGGCVHYYEILDMEGLEQRMEELKALGFEIKAKREVHGYSASLSMYSLTATFKGA